MKLALIGHGNMPIPPKGWGAVEGIIWNYKTYLERAGHTVDIFNSRQIHLVIHEINGGRYEFAHCHNELFVLDCIAHLQVPFAVTSHAAITRLASGNYEYKGAQRFLLEDTLRAPANILLSDRTKAIYERHVYRGFIRVLRNGVETEKFKTRKNGNGKAVCIGRISRRKRQRWLSEVARDRVYVDFVGPYDRSEESFLSGHQHANYLGSWDRESLYKHLCEYSCLVLLSSAEAAAPLVVLEALAAGLSVVISEACAPNLTHEEFITVIPDEEQRADVIAQAIQTAVDKNAGLRSAIRSYARKRFDFAAIVREYVGIVDDVRHSQDRRAITRVGRAIVPRKLLIPGLKKFRTKSPL